jgi:hypothetical protein
LLFIVDLFPSYASDKFWAPIKSSRAVLGRELGPWLIFFLIQPELPTLLDILQALFFGRAGWNVRQL